MGYGEAVVGAAPMRAASSLSVRHGEPRASEGGGEKRKRTHRPLLLPLPSRQKKGSEEPDDLRVKGGISDQAGRHLAFSEASITHMFFPTTGKLNLPISFVDSLFPRHHRCLLTLHIQEKKTQVSASRQTGNLIVL